MSPEELRAAAAWLNDLTGRTWPWQIETADDLREWASEISSHCEDELTGAEMRQVRDLIEKLDPPEEQARKARRAKRQAKKQVKFDVDNPEPWIAGLDAWVSALDARSEQREIFQSKGAAARKQQGVKTRNAILQKYKKSTLPKRERAGSIAESLGLWPQHVRRVLKEGALK